MWKIEYYGRNSDFGQLQAAREYTLLFLTNDQKFLRMAPPFIEKHIAAGTGSTNITLVMAYYEMFSLYNKVDDVDYDSVVLQCFQGNVHSPTIPGDILGLLCEIANQSSHTLVFNNKDIRE
ncbi:hypothetical protein GGI16_001386 [Coemansia sp. S142-1]|nr:hypothetical protein GGI16_001386 [Coemansia sp. S142-1]